MAVVGVAPYHPILTQKKGVKSVHFSTGKKKDLSEIKISGKRKRGAFYLVPETSICKVELLPPSFSSCSTLHPFQHVFCLPVTCSSCFAQVECDDGTHYQFRALVPGNLIEINSKLIENPNLLVEKVPPLIKIRTPNHIKLLSSDLKPSTEGYLAILNPGKVDIRETLNKYKSLGEYQVIRGSL